jgi:hypothetical protein
MKVCVVGTGPCGLTTVKQLLDEGHEVTCFEKNSAEGGIWFRHENDADEMKVYDNLILTISSKLMAFSDFMPEGDRVFFTHQQYLRYLQDYAKKFGLREHIQFDSEVTNVRKTKDGRYCVTVLSKGKNTEHTFDALALCLGPFKTPNFGVADLEKFTGEVVHSSRYRNADRFRKKRVLVVGMAESGADILREISDVASACTLSIRSYSFLVPRLLDGEHSTDAGTLRAQHWECGVRAVEHPYPTKAMFGDTTASKAVFFTAAIAYGMGTVLSRAVSKLFGAKPSTPEPRTTNNLGSPMLPLKIDVDADWTQENVDAIDEWNRRSHNNEGNWTPKIIFCKNVNFIPNIVNGKIEVNDKGIERIDGKRVYFKDGISGEFDAMVLSTGFVQNFSTLGEDIKVKDNNVRNLYKHAFDPDHDGRVAWIGFVRPYTGGIPICAELQARYFALLCSGEHALPSDIRERIETEKAWEDKLVLLSPAHTETIPSQALFCDSIAKEIGCLMPMSQLVRHPSLLVRHWFYPFNQSCYRLVGPHSMRDAAMKEFLSNKAGPLSGSIPILAFSLLTVLPRSIHPKDLGGGGGALGCPRPPKGALWGKDHYLIRDAHKRPRLQRQDEKTEHSTNGKDARSSDKRRRPRGCSVQNMKDAPLSPSTSTSPHVDPEAYEGKAI